jgi:hypothetical protein
VTVPTADGRQFMLGKYEVRAAPIAQSAHMLRYTVYLDGKRIGSMASMPSESDCHSLAHPDTAQDAQPHVPSFQHRVRPPRPTNVVPPRTPVDASRFRYDERLHGNTLPKPTDER